MVCGVAAAAPAPAQPATVLAFLQKVNREVPPPSRPQIDAAIEAMQERLRAKTPGECQPTISVIDAPRPATADRMIFNAAAKGQARNGWTVQARLGGCETGTQRFVLALLSDGTLVAIPANQGESLTTSSQFRDTALQLVAAVATVPSLRAPACTGAPDRIVTSVTAREPDLGPDVFGGRYAGSWRETWTVHQCRQRVAVTIAFVADGDGGVTTRIANDSVKLLN